MKRLFAFITAALLALVSLPFASSVTRAEANAADAASLNEALNAAGVSLNYSTDSQYPWVVDGDAAKSSNEGVANSTSSVWTNFTSVQGDVLQFDWISMGEGPDLQDWDGLRVYLDGAKILHKGAGHPDWERFQTTLEPGAHELTFTYKKDGGIDREGDFAKIDNVYVGRIVTPSSIAVQQVNVHAGRTESVAYTVLPDETFDKSVTFSVADTSIATVDVNGVVNGVSEGTTTVTVTSVADPTVSGTAAVHVLDPLNDAYLYGFCLFDVGMNGMEGHLVGFDEASPENIEDVFDLGETTYSSAYAGGKVYGYLYNHNATDTRFFTLDTQTYEISYPGASYATGMIAMAFNHADQTMYGINAATPAKLVSINTFSGIVTEIAPITGMNGTPMTLAIDLDGNAYFLESVNNEAVLCRLDLATGEATEVGGTGVSMKYIQSMVYDFNTDKIYWAQNYDTEKTGLYVIDPQTAQTEPRGKIGPAGMELTGLYIKNNIPVDIQNPNVTVTFLDNITNLVVETRSVPSGSVLDPETFPVPPAHPGFTFIGWNYIAGTPIHRDTTITTKYYDPQATTAVVVLNVPNDIWGDGSGYQMLIDADATAYGNEIPLTNGAISAPGNVPGWIYAAFEHRIPENADGVLTTQNIVVQNSISIEIPAGTYDWVIVNPVPNDRVYIASDNGNADGRANDFVFEAGKTYTFTVSEYHTSDKVDLTITLGGTTPQQPIGEPGDIDLNGSITIADAVLALRHALGLITLEGQALANGDVDGSGGVTVADAVQILRRSMGLMDGF